MPLPTRTARRDRPAAPAEVAPPLAVDALSLTERRALGDQLYPIFSESYGALSYDVVCDEIIFRRGGDLFLIHQDGELVGFAVKTVESIAHQGRTVNIFEGGIYVRRGVSGVGLAWMPHAFKACLREKLRNPLRPQYYVMEALTPVSYRRGARSFPRLYPHRSRATPSKLAGLLRAVLAHRGLRRSGDHPFVVRYPDPATHAEPQRILLNERLRDDPDVRFYLAHNPGFQDGDILAAIIPLNFTELAIGLLTRSA